MHLTKEELLIKRFNSLVGKIPIPRLNTDAEKEAYIALFELNEPVTVEYVKSILFPFHLELDEHDMGKYVLQLGDVADLETITFNLKQNINRSTKHQLSNKPAILPNCCYVLCYFFNLKFQL